MNDDPASRAIAMLLEAAGTFEELEESKDGRDDPGFYQALADACDERAKALAEWHMKASEAVERLKRK